MDMSKTIAPKSDQFNADDLISGPRTVTITRVSGNDNADQPVNVFFDGDGGKPYRPCKQMRRVMVAIWGADAAQYVGRSMTLYRDPEVQFGGMKVGGIRISHMSGIDKAQTMALTVTRAVRKPFTVQPIADKPAPPPVDHAATRDRLSAAIKAQGSTTTLHKLCSQAGFVAARESLPQPMQLEVSALYSARHDELTKIEDAANLDAFGLPPIAGADTEKAE